MAHPVRHRKPVAFEFVLDALGGLDYQVRPMFGATALYRGEKIILILREKEEFADDNGVWLATAPEHHESLREDFPDFRSRPHQLAEPAGRIRRLRIRGAESVRADPPRRPEDRKDPGAEGQEKSVESEITEEEITEEESGDESPSEASQKNPERPPMSHACIAGASGLVGGHLLDELLADPRFERVTALVRRPLGRQHPKLHEVQVDFLHLNPLPTGAFQADEAFCCLGSTIRKAGSQKAFREVDFDAVTGLAQAVFSAGTRSFSLVSALGADPDSRVFYNRVKGEAERSLQQIGFRTLRIFRPSLLLGARPEFRAGERVAAVLSPILRPLLSGPFKRYRPIEARTVARALWVSTRLATLGIQIVESEEIARMGAEKQNPESTK